MARHEKKGAGMTERLVTIPETPAEQLAAFDAWHKAQPVAQPGELLGFARHRVNADRLRAVLATVGMEDRGEFVPDLARLRELGLGENSAQWIAAHWLAEYNTLLSGCQRLEGGSQTPNVLARVLMAAEEMGRLQERLWWRAGVDHESGEKREALALTGRPVKRGQKDAAAKTNRKHIAMRERRAERIRELLPSMNLESAAAHCEAEGLGKAGAIVRQWNRRKEN